nr:T9SS type A sorting domain-containing protein [Saprospiraceae bacterium]
MKFTKVSFNVLFTVLLLASGGQLAYSQWVFEITSPASVAGTYEYGLANFGTTEEFEAELALGFDNSADPSFACEEVVTDLTGKIGVIDRGGCFFSQKAYNTQEAGAIAVVVCNNQPGTITMAPGDFAELVDVQVIMLDQSDCISIKAAMEDGPVIGKSYFKGWDEEGVLWGLEPGQGDFANGLGDWTTVGLSDPDHVWEYKEDATTNGGCGANRINSYSVANGAVVFDADFYITGGPADEGGLGCAGSETAIQGELWSPIIDCSDFNQVAIEFLQYNLGISLDPAPGSVRERTYMQFSTDGGLNWGERVLITTSSFRSTAGSATVNPERVIVVVPEASNEADFRFKFVHDGGFYSWSVDDIRLVNPPENDLVMEDAFYPPLSFATPNDHIGVDTFGLFCFISNEGFNVQENVVASVEIYNTQTDEVFHEQTVELGSMSRGQLDTVLFDSFAPELPIGNYAIRYQVENLDFEDDVPEDNFTEFSFVVTETLFAKDDLSRTSFAGGITNPDDSWYWGNLYFISPLIDEIANAYFLGAEFAFVPTEGSYTDENAVVHLLEFVPEGPIVNYQALNENSNLSPQDHPSWNQVALAIITTDMLENAGVGGLLQVDVSDFLDPVTFQPIDDPLILNAGKLYGVIVQHEGDQLRMPVTTVSYSTGVGLLYVDNASGSKQYFSGYSGNGGPIVRMITEVFPNSVNPELTLENIINVYPVPASNDLYVDLEMEHPTDVQFQLYDMQGRLLNQTHHKNVTKETIHTDTRRYQSGNYIIRVQTLTGSESRSVLILKE